MLEQLREQVNNVMAVLQLLTPMIHSQGERRYEEYLAIANQSLYRLLRMMNNVEFAQQAGQGAPAAYHPAVLDLAGLCRELGRQVEPLASKAGVSFRYEESRGNLLLQGDTVLLRRLLLNLIANALRAAGQGGQAGLRLSEQPGRAILTVWDLCVPGADPGAQFTQNRLGLGLAIARSIAALHGGTVVFEARPNQGGRATVSLPLKKTAEEGTLRTPRPGYDPMGGFSPVLVELSDVLPYQAFAADDLE